MSQDVQFFHNTHTFFAILKSVSESAKSPFSKFNVHLFLIINLFFFRLIGRYVGLQKVFNLSDLEESSPNVAVFDVFKAFASNLL